MGKGSRLSRKARREEDEKARWRYVIDIHMKKRHKDTSAEDIRCFFELLGVLREVRQYCGLPRRFYLDKDLVTARKIIAKHPACLLACCVESWSERFPLIRKFSADFKDEELIKFVFSQPVVVRRGFYSVMSFSEGEGMDDDSDKEDEDDECSSYYNNSSDDDSDGDGGIWYTYETFLRKAKKVIDRAPREWLVKEQKMAWEVRDEVLQAPEESLVNICLSIVAQQSDLLLHST